MAGPEATTRVPGRERIIISGLLIAVGLMAALAIVRTWSRVFEPLAPGRDFGLDLLAYLGGAQRLIATGSPYDPSLFNAPIPVGAIISTGYFYPPPLAQLFVPLTLIDYNALTVVWVLAQVVVLAWLIPTLYRRGGGVLTLASGLGLMLLCLASRPLTIALFIGNVSGWMAILVGYLLLTGSALPSGLIGPAMAFLKLSPAPFLVASLVSRPTRRAAAVVASIILVVSFVLAPVAWTDFARLLPHLGEAAPAPTYGNLAPAAVIGRYGVPTVGRLIGLALIAIFAVATVVFARRDGLTPRTIAAASVATCFFGTTMWDHYLAILVPLIVFAWPSADRRRRLILFAYMAWGVTDWVYEVAGPGMRVVSLILIVTVAAELGLRRWPTAPTRTPLAEPSGRDGLPTTEGSAA